MFDVGFSELVVIGVVALIVVGPERLPKVARTAGVLLARLQRYVNGVKADINREIQLDELKKLQQQMAEQASTIQTAVTSEMKAVEASLAEMEHPLADVPPAAATLPVDVPAAAVATAPEIGTEAPSAQQLELGLAQRDEKQANT